MHTKTRQRVVTVVMLGLCVVGCQSAPSDSEMREEAWRVHEQGRAIDEQVLRDVTHGTGKIPRYTGAGGVRTLGPVPDQRTSDTNSGRHEARQKGGHDVGDPEHAERD
jgi:hypothetical protein